MAYSFAPGDKVETRKGVGHFIGVIGASAFVGVANRVEKVRLIDVKRTDAAVTESVSKSVHPTLEEWEANYREENVPVAVGVTVLSERDAIRVVDMLSDDEPNEALVAMVKKAKPKLPRLTKKFFESTSKARLEELLDEFQGAMSKFCTKKLIAAIAEKSE